MKATRSGLSRTAFRMRPRGVPVKANMATVHRKQYTAIR